MKHRGTAHTHSRYDWMAPLYNLMEWPVEQLWYNKWRQRLWKQIEGPKVLELGVGTGKNIPYYPDALKITGIDLSPGMLKRARKRVRDRDHEGLTLLEMDAQQLDFAEGTFDEVVATFVFCSVPDPVAGLREALRVTRPGGRLHLLEHMRADAPFPARLMKLLDPPIHYLSGVHIARTTVANVREAGWRIDRVTDLTRTGIFKRIEATKAP